MNAAEWVGRSVADPDGESYGVLEELFVGRRSGRPEFGVLGLAAGTTGGLKRIVVPLRDARPEADRLVLPLDRERVLTAPAMRAEVEEITPEAGRRVLDHFGLADTPDDEAATLNMPHVDDDGEPRSMTVSEEQLVVDTEPRAAERVRVRKAVVTEDVTITVTVRREELVIERETLDRPAADLTWSDASTAGESEAEFTLHVEEPVVTKRVVPVERVRLHRDTVVEERRVSGEVRKEQVDIEQTPIPKEPT